MGRRSAQLGLLSVLGASILLAGCPQWFSKMKETPSVQPYEARHLMAPPGSVPVGGREPPLSLEEAEGLENPVPVTESSLANGQRLYRTYCLVCHGPEGQGDGPVAAKFIPPPDLTGPRLVGQSDGYIYGMIRNGRVMPAYGPQIAPRDRWDVVNYVRSLRR